LRATGPDALRVSATEFGQVASFNRYGAAYSVTLECDDPQTDPRCADDVLVRRLARSLVIAAGSPGEARNFFRPTPPGRGPQNPKTDGLIAPWTAAVVLDQGYGRNTALSFVRMP